MRSSPHARSSAVSAATGALRFAIAAAGAALLAGCPAPTQSTVGERNLTDPTNGGAGYLGSGVCITCHADVAATQAIHAHAYALQRAVRAAPRFPAEARLAGVPNPPAGVDWAAVSYVEGGFAKGALFVDQDGFLLTNASTGVDSQWRQTFPVNGVAASFGPFGSDAGVQLRYDFERFRYRTTGATPPDAENPTFQENRPGIAGGWSEPGVQCEACHGPGDAHVRTTGSNVVIDRSRVYIDTQGASTCNICHSGAFDAEPRPILAADGFIRPQQQAGELRASGGHADFTCMFCHEPHHGVAYDRAAAIRNECTACHTTENMAGHAGAVFVRGDYREPLTCESCHMPYAVRTASNADAATVGPAGRVGDTRAHIFRINTDPAGAAAMFSADGARVRTDSQGLAGVSVDFVCLRCHNGLGNVFNLTLPRAAEIAPNVHRLP